jgi:ATP phosphoribosyltransferase regulatory subunit
MIKILMKTSTPIGVQDLTPEENKRLDSLLAKCDSVAKKAHFQKVRTPVIEYEETLLPGIDPDLKERTIRFFDSYGNTLLLRPDSTAAVARLVATQLRDEPKPLRLFYQHPIFQQADRDSHKDIELFQTGVELMGQAGSEADAEVIILLIDMCLEMGLSSVRIDIGHTQFLKGLSDSKKEALLKGDYIAYGEIPERGGLEIVQSHDDLLSLYRVLEKRGYEKYIRFNKGLVKEFSYYTGIIFEAYTPGAGQIIASGGRYDDLIAKFGYPCSAVGFALNMNVIQGVAQ